ncbi:RCC1 domain-containing protein [Nesterenkonia rhizosphaerae]
MGTIRVPHQNPTTAATTVDRRVRRQPLRRFLAVLAAITVIGTSSTPTQATWNEQAQASASFTTWEDVFAWEQVSTGDSHTCAIADVQVYCWGYGYFGALGNGSTTDQTVPVPVDTHGPLAGRTVTSIAAGGRHTCALADGQVYCWGDGIRGQLGDGSRTNQTVPVAVDFSGALAGKTVTSIAAGGSHTCAIADGQAYCWGSGTNGQLGDGSGTNQTAPVAVDASGALAGKTVTSIAGGGTYTCALADGQPYCWGYGTAGQLGNGSTMSQRVPVAVDTSGVLAGKTVTSVSAGSSHACAVAGGQAYCWGFGGRGRLGNGDTRDSTVPVAVDTSGVLANKTVASVSAGGHHTCAVAGGQAYCWGQGDAGRLGNGGTGNSTVPVAVDTSGVLAGKTVTSVSAVFEHTCGVAEGQAYCWGAGGSGKLGNGRTTNQPRPVAVLTP